MEQAGEKFERGMVPGVAIDGATVRTIRETKKLTQLYVASVVGVTTDTISRWENNRYPSIKKENAEKLARALEVDLVDIVRQEEENELDAAVIAELSSPDHRWIWITAGAAIALFILIFLFTRPSSPAPTATRWAPRYAAPGEVIPVQIKVTRLKGDTSGFILKERVPDGFRIIGSLPSSSAGDGSGEVIKWLVPGGDTSITVSYTLLAPAGPVLHNAAKLGGEIVVRTGGGTRTETVGGSEAVTLGAYHWADTNGDGRIDDDEIMPAYYVCEDMKGLGLVWKTIEAIWSGKGYRWDPKAGYMVLK
jgi:transcriptional regulator with XRE-family HTH domain